MPTPWLQIGNLVLRNLDTIIGVVGPAFTRKKAQAAALTTEQPDVLSTQITELQAAASRNADQIRQLAEELRKVVVTLEEAAVEASAERRRMRALCLGAIGISLMAIAAVAFVLLAR